MDCNGVADGEGVALVHCGHMCCSDLQHQILRSVLGPPRVFFYLC